jgi:hypothetical protein
MSFKKKNTNGIVGSFEKQAIPVDVFELSDTDSHPRNPKIVFWVFFHLIVYSNAWERLMPLMYKNIDFITKFYLGKSEFKTCF